MLELILLVIALVCFVAAAVGWPPVRVNLMATGLALWVAEEIVKGIPR